MAYRISFPSSLCLNVFMDCAPTMSDVNSFQSRTKCVDASKLCVLCPLMVEWGALKKYSLFKFILPANAPSILINHFQWYKSPHFI